MGGHTQKDGEPAGVVRIWEAADGRELAALYDVSSWASTALAFSPDGQILARGNADGYVALRTVPERLRC